MHDLCVRKWEPTEPTPECSWLTTMKAHISSVNRQGSGHQVVPVCAGANPLSGQPEWSPCRKPRQTQPTAACSECQQNLSPLGAITGEKRSQSNSLALKRAVLTPCFCFLCDDPIPASLSDAISPRSQLYTAGKLLLFSAALMQWPGHTGVTLWAAQGTDWQRRQNPERWILRGSKLHLTHAAGKTSGIDSNFSQPILPGLLV